MNTPKITAIIAAAGNSTRMNGINKQLFEICGKPVIAHTIDAFERANLVTDIVIVTREDDIDEYKELCTINGFKKVSAIVAGGRERYDSVQNGIKLAQDSDYIAIHDGARACITPKQIDMLCRVAMAKGAVVPGCIVTDTVKRVKDGKITENIERQGLFTVQTPQIFKADMLIDAYSKFTGENVTDDASVAQMAGYDVSIVEMPPTNIKITTPDDLEKAEKILGM